MAGCFSGNDCWIVILSSSCGGVYNFRADQTVSGVAINLLAVGLTMFLVKMIYDKGQTDRITETFPRIDVPLLSDIPFIGPILFSNGYYIVYIAILISFVVWYVTL